MAGNGCRAPLHTAWIPRGQPGGQSSCSKKWGLFSRFVRFVASEKCHYAANSRFERAWAMRTILARYVLQPAFRN